MPGIQTPQYNIPTPPITGQEVGLQSSAIAPPVIDPNVLPARDYGGVDLGVNLTVVNANVAAAQAMASAAFVAATGGVGLAAYLATVPIVAGEQVINLTGVAAAGKGGGLVAKVPRGGRTANLVTTYATNAATDPLALYLWEREITGRAIDPAWAGADGGGVVNDRAALLAASAIGQLHLAQGATHAVATTVTLGGGIRPAGGKIKPAAGQTVYVAGPVHARKEHWIDHSAGGAVAFPLEHMPPEIFPQWWGASGKDDITLADQNRDAFAAMFAMMATAPDASKCTVVIPAGVYYVSCDPATGIAVDFEGLSHITFRTQGGQVVFIWTSPTGGTAGVAYERGVLWALRNCSYNTFDGQIYLQCHHPTDPAKRAHVGVWICDKWHWTGTMAWGYDGATSIPATKELTSALNDFGALGVAPGDFVEIHDLGTPGDNYPRYVVAGVLGHVITVDRDFPVGSLANLSFRVYSDGVGVHTLQSMHRLHRVHVYGYLEWGIAVGDRSWRTYNTDQIHLLHCHAEQGSAATPGIAGAVLADPNTNCPLCDAFESTNNQLCAIMVDCAANAVVRAPAVIQYYNATYPEHACVHVAGLGHNFTLKEARLELYGAPLLTTAVGLATGSRIIGQVTIERISNAYARVAAPAPYPIIKYTGQGVLVLDSCRLAGPRGEAGHATEIAEIIYAPEANEGEQTFIHRNTTLIQGARYKVDNNGFACHPVEVGYGDQRLDTPAADTQLVPCGMQLRSNPSYFAPDTATRKNYEAGRNTVSWDCVCHNPGMIPYVTQLVAGRGGTLYKTSFDYRALNWAAQSGGIIWLRCYGMFLVRAIWLRVMSNFTFPGGENVVVYTTAGGANLTNGAGLPIKGLAAPFIYPASAADLDANMVNAANYYNGGYLADPASAKTRTTGFEILVSFWGGTNFGDGAATFLTAGELEVMIDLVPLELPGERMLDDYT